MPFLSAYQGMNAVDNVIFLHNRNVYPTWHLHLLWPTLLFDFALPV